jgi:hypothetical protein
MGAFLTKNLSPSGRRPDLTITRNSVSYAVEAAALGLDREFRGIERYCDELKSQLRRLERQHQIELTCRSAEILGEEDLSAWLAEIGQACERTAMDDHARTVVWGGSARAGISPQASGPPGASSAVLLLLAMYGAESPSG